MRPEAKSRGMALSECHFLVGPRPHNFCATRAIRPYNSWTFWPRPPCEKEVRLARRRTFRLPARDLPRRRGPASTNRSSTGGSSTNGPARTKIRTRIRTAIKRTIGNEVGKKIRGSVGRDRLRLRDHRKALRRALFYPQRQSFGLLRASSNVATGRHGARAAPVALGTFRKRGRTAFIPSGVGSKRWGRLASWSVVPRTSGPL